jgi:hypothetical protein
MNLALDVLVDVMLRQQEVTQSTTQQLTTMDDDGAAFKIQIPVQQSCNKISEIHHEGKDMRGYQVECLPKTWHSRGSGGHVVEMCFCVLVEGRGEVCTQGANLRWRALRSKTHVKPLPQHCMKRTSVADAKGDRFCRICTIFLRRAPA